MHIDSVSHLVKSRFFFNVVFCAIRNESVAFFNLSIHGYTSSVSLTILECLGFLTLRQPKLSLLCCGRQPLVEIIHLFAIFVEVLNGLFIFIKLQRMYCMCTLKSLEMSL